jgi:hypothetical protein
VPIAATPVRTVPAEAPVSEAVPIGGPATETSAIPRAAKVTTGIPSTDVTAGVSTADVTAGISTADVTAGISTTDVTASVPASSISPDRRHVSASVTAAISTEAALRCEVPSAGETCVTSSESTSCKSTVTARKSAMASASAHRGVPATTAATTVSPAAAAMLRERGSRRDQHRCQRAYGPDRAYVR